MSFSGIDLAIDDYEGPAHASTFMVSSATSINADHLRRPVRIIANRDNQDSVHHFLCSLQSELKSRGFDVSVVFWESEITAIDATNLIIDLSPSPVLLSSTPEKFGKITDLLTREIDILWVSMNNDKDSIRYPEASLATGLARSAHAENKRVNIVTLDVQQAFDVENEGPIVKIICDLVSASLSSSTDDISRREREYVFRDGHLLIPRLVLHEELQKRMSGKPEDLDPVMDVFGKSDRPLQLTPSNTGSSDDLLFEDDDTTRVSLGEQEIEIAVKAHGINYGTLAFACGQIKADEIVSEVAGIVTALGSKVSGFSIGDRVNALWRHPCASRARCDRDSVYKLPPLMTFTQGASIPVSFMTAYYCLISLAKLNIDQTVIITAAGSAIGEAAIILAKSIGAVVFAIVSSATEKKTLIETFKMYPSNVFIEDEPLLWQKLLEATSGDGADLILDCGSQAPPEDSSTSVAFSGSVIQIIEPAMAAKARMRALHLSKNLTFQTFNLIALMQHRPFEATALFTKVMSMFVDKILQPLHSITAMPITQIGEALQTLQTSAGAGKLVVESEDCIVKTMTRSRFSMRLDENASYIIAGGFGDVGRKLSELMIQRGARNIVILSRRALSKEEHQKVELDLRSSSPNFRLTWKSCNIANYEQVMKCAVDLLSSNIPPVRGVINAALALKVRLKYAKSRVHC